MSRDSASGERAALRARILAERADLARTVEALAAKTRLRARARRAAHDEAVEAGAAVAALPGRAGQWIRRAVGSARGRLAVFAMFAVLASAVTALLAAVRPRGKGSAR